MDSNGESVLRSRMKQTEPSVGDKSPYSRKGLEEDRFEKEAEPLSRVGRRHWLLMMAMVASFYLLAVFMDSRMPAVVKDDGGFHTFSEARARRFLEKLAGFGPKPAGSEACEVKAYNLIMETLKTTQRMTNEVGVNRLELDVQRPSGCFDLGFMSEFTLCYRNITNIMARFGPKTGPTAHSVLVNCHFDTIPDSPGASDDGVSCAVMIEMLQVMAKSKEVFENDVLFLFNGAEENFLQGSHGFIRHHPWRHTIRAFLNLEAAGAGGRELLFQAGPGNSWLVKTYLESAPRPYCTVLAQDVFQSGIVPADTDFRIFRDYGRIPGLDIAYIKNGYVYHTEHDLPQYIMEGAIQRAGENHMAVVKALANSPYLAHPGDYNEGDWVFFDVLGLFVVYYSKAIGTVFNYIGVVVVFLKVMASLIRGRKNQSVGAVKRGRSGLIEGISNSGRVTILVWCVLKIPGVETTSYSPSDLIVAILVQLSAAIGCIAAGLFMVRIVTLLDLTMVWYAQQWTIYFLYYLPCVMGGLAIHGLVAEKFYLKRDPYLIEQCYFDAFLSILAIALFLMTRYGIATAYLLLINVAFCLFREPLRWVWGRLTNDREWFRNGRLLIRCHAAVLCPVMLYGCYSLLLGYQIFIPVMGRSGMVINTELFIMGLSSLAAFSFLLYTGSLMYASRRVWYLMKCTIAIICLLLVVLSVTRLGEPYQYSVDSPRLKKCVIVHTTRTLHSEIGGQQPKIEHGLFVHSFDYRGTDDLPSDILAGGSAPNCSDTEDEYCRLPYYTAMVTMLPPKDTRWVPTPSAPVLKYPVKLDLLERKEMAKDRVNISFTVDGPDHITLHMTPVNGWLIEDWSLKDAGVSFSKSSKPRKTYFAFICYGKYPGEWRFWIVMQRSNSVSTKSSSMSHIEVSAAAFHTSGPWQRSELINSTKGVINNRRTTPQLAVGFWRWAIVPIMGNAEVVQKWF